VDSVLTQNGIKLIFSSPLTWFDSYWPVDSVFIKNDIFYPDRHSLTHIDPMSVFFLEKGSWLEKIYFWILNFFLIFLDFYEQK
jgi:hypothetical protein